MDPLRLLSRGTKGKAGKSAAGQQKIIPSADDAKPQLFSEDRPAKRRRLETDSEFDENLSSGKSAPQEATQDGLETIKSILKQHKIKVSWFRTPPVKKSKRSADTPAKIERIPIFPPPLHDFSKSSLATDTVPAQLAKNIQSQGYSTATEVQMAAIPLLTRLAGAAVKTEGLTLPDERPNLLTVAPTGSGKTLAFLIPTITRLLASRAGTDIIERRTQALILAPTKELVGQIVNEGKILLRGIDLKITAYKKDMRLEAGDEEDTRTVAKPDILVSTPGVLSTAIATTAPLSGVQYLILDEADVLLDPLFREQTVNIWKSLLDPELRVSLWSATMGSSIEDMALSLTREQQQTSGASADIPFVRLVVGLKDSAVPNIQHRLVYAASEQGKLMGLRTLLHPATSADEALRPPFIVFTQTVERAMALHAELQYDIPAEAGGPSRIAVLHANLSDAKRADVMTKFRSGDIWVLITTDLLSRGIDFRGVNGVVNYDIPTSSAAYVHRAGRTGRAGREGGVAVTLYTKDDIPYLKHIANSIVAAQKQGGLDADAGIQQWLLDALPTLSKNDKERFKKRGVEARTARGMTNDPKAARRARISTKSGFQRRIENNRKGAAEASRRRKAEAKASGEDDNGFSGFD